ncbi:hypothetical protein MMC24_003101 [Lignoscripta atroalba]|nr:hypothetical protein [Lignoscripta atroalba]
MDSSPSRTEADTSQVRGVKRPAPICSLLPAFEPRSSSPCLPPPPKRLASASQVNYNKDTQKYPTPVPTSSTGIFSSSPPPSPRPPRHVLRRMLSTRSERAPLSDVPTIELHENGEPILMGRSSNSSNYQLSAEPHISRIHVQAKYIPAYPPTPSKVEVLCLGWNGMRVHCQGKAHELGKNESFSSDDQDAGIMIDVQDTRVLLRWPRTAKKASALIDSTSIFDDENSPRQSTTGVRRQASYSSPLRSRSALESPISLPHAVPNATATSSTNIVSDPQILDSVQVYEDEESDHEGRDCSGAAGATQSTQHVSQPLGAGLEPTQSSTLGEVEEFSDQDEENDPIVHSFGPFGGNILSRMASFPTGDSPEQRMATFPTSGSPEQRRDLVPQPEDPTPPESTSSSDPSNDHDQDQIINHAINQLVFSRLASTPLSTILSHLPAIADNDSTNAQESKTISAEILKGLLDGTQCIGEVAREGKDAAGKPLESEYYYIPDLDSDEKRRDAVVEDLRKPGLRACRKQHKVGIAIPCYLANALCLLTNDNSNTSGEDRNSRTKDVLSHGQI